MLKDNGYRTYISGKWHLGLTPETNAHAKGFDHSFTLLQGLDHHFKQAPSAFKRNSTYTEDGQIIPISALPDDFFSTNYFTDKLLSYLESGKNSGKPFLPMQPIQHPTGLYKRQQNTVKNIVAFMTLVTMLSVMPVLHAKSNLNYSSKF